MKLTAMVLVILATVGFSFLPCHAQQANAALTSEQRAGLPAPAIPGRASKEQVQATLAAADQEGRQAFSDLVQQTTVLPNTLLSIQEQARRWGRASNPCLQKISSFQGRLGQSLHPKQVEDIVAMNQLLSRTVDGQVNYCRGQLQSLTNSDCFALFTSVSAAIDVEKQREEQIQIAKKAVIDVEDALGRGDLSRANQLYQRLATDSKLPPFALSYIQQTRSLREDLLAYAQAVAINHGQSMTLPQQLQNLSSEVSLLHECGTKRPLTQAYLEHAIKNDVDASREQLAKLPTFQFNESSYRIPAEISESDELTLISSHIKTIDESLAKVSELRAMIAQPEAMKTVGEIVGGNEAAGLKATADQIVAAERMRGSLEEARNALQGKIAAENKAREEEERERIAALEAKRQAVEARKRAELAEEKRGRLAAEWKTISDSKEIVEPSAEMCTELESRSAGIQRKSLGTISDKERFYLVKCVRRDRPEKPLLVFRNRWVRHLQFGMTQEEIATPGVALDGRWLFDSCNQSDADKDAYMQAVVRCRYWYSPNGNAVVGARVLQLAFGSDDRLKEWEYREFFSKANSSVQSVLTKVTNLADLGLADWETKTSMSWNFHSKTELNNFGVSKTLETVDVSVVDVDGATSIGITYHDAEALSIVYTGAH